MKPSPKNEFNGWVDQQLFEPKINISEKKKKKKVKTTRNIDSEFSISDHINGNPHKKSAKK